MTDSELVELTQQLLNSIASGDYSTYENLCSSDLTCFEPECSGNLVEGLPFHKFFFDLPKSATANKAPPATVSMSGVHVRRLAGGDGAAAVVSYIRINQFYSIDETGKMDGPKITQSCETRVWEKDPKGQWKNVHVHRS